ncbi:hypothetical protein Tco_1471062 [Tanacetum coccineum]
MSVPFVHRTSVVSVLAPMETMLYLLHMYCTLPPEGTCCSLPPEETSCSLPLKETSCFLPLEKTSCSLPLEETSCSLPLEGTSCSLLLEETSCSLPLEETSCFLPLDRTSYSLVIAFGPEVAFVTPAIPVDRSNMEWSHPEAVRARLEISTGSYKARLEVIKLVRRLPRPALVSFEGGFVHFFQLLLEVYFEFHLTFLMAKKDMHTYVSRLKDTELETLIATYDIPLDLRPRMPDPNFRMINLPGGDTAIGAHLPASSSRFEQDTIQAGRLVLFC